MAHKSHPFCAETRLFCVEIELLRRNATLFRGKTHVFRRNTAVLRRNMRLLRRDTAVLRRNMHLLRRNTAVLRRNLKQPPRIAPLKFLVLLVPGAGGIRLEYFYHIALVKSCHLKCVYDMKKWYMHFFYYMKDLVVKDNLMKFGIISSHIFPTLALRSSPESTQIVRNSFARSAGLYMR